jgi:hypothetical protein
MSDSQDELVDFNERVEQLGEQIAPFLAEEEHLGVCVYTLLNALGHELQMMITDCGAKRAQVIKQVHQDLEEILDFQLESEKSDKKNQKNNKMH